MKTARAAAVLTWIYAAGFGLSAIPVAAYLVADGHLPTFMGLFEMYGGPWSARVEPRTFVALLAAFLGVTILAALSAWWLWLGRRSGAVLNLALLPIEAIFWFGFALPLSPGSAASLGRCCWPRRGRRWVTGAAAGLRCRHGHRSPHEVELI
jgi:hypothetical protein